MFKAIGRALLVSLVISAILSAIFFKFLGPQAHEDHCKEIGYDEPGCEQFEETRPEIQSQLNILKLFLNIFEFMVFFVPCFISSLIVGLWYEFGLRKQTKQT